MPGPTPTSYQALQWTTPQLRPAGMRVAVLWSDRAPLHKLRCKKSDSGKAYTLLFLGGNASPLGAFLKPLSECWMYSTPSSDCPVGGPYAPAGRPGMLKAVVTVLIQTILQGRKLRPEQQDLQAQDPEHTHHRPRLEPYPILASSSSFSPEDNGRHTTWLGSWFPIKNSFYRRWCIE